MRPHLRRALTLIGISSGLLVVAGAGALHVRTPAADRNWKPENARVPEVRFDGSIATIRNVRNFGWQSESGFTERWETRRYDLDRLESVWFLVSPFGALRGPAHTFMSFGFADSAGSVEYVSVSVEVRKEVGESYSPIRGMLREYELIYVVGDERDLVRLRSNVWRDSVYLYRIRTTPEKARALFRAMLERGSGLGTSPEFYHTLRNSCTMNIVNHVNAIAPNRVPSSYKVHLAAFADELAYELGLLDTSRPLADLKREALINPLAIAAADDRDFSARIRANR